jgi:uncharacterized RDD family membrane protein YckC
MSEPSSQWGPPAPPAPYSPPPPPRWTPPPGVELAGWGSRAAAQIIDNVIGLVVVVGLAVIAGFAVAAGVDGDTGALVGVLTYFGGTLVWMCAYTTFTMMRTGRHNGQTWGKQLLSIRVARLDSWPVNAGTALLRDTLMKQILLWGLGSMIFYVGWLLDILWPLWDGRNQSIHDKVASTVVIRA